MDFNEYQKKAKSFAIYTDHNYPALGLAEETGELLGKLAKASRDGINDGREFALSLKKEAGDVLWMLATLMWEHGIQLDEVAELNIQKLEDRKNRNVIKGAGDNR